MSLLTGCPFDTSPTKLIEVPFYKQLQFNYCGIACIQMWSHYTFPGDGPPVTQDEIADFLGVGIELVHPNQLAEGVDFFCALNSDLAKRRQSDIRAQGDLIGGMVASIIDDNPTLTPFENDHVVLVVGFRYHERPIYDEYGVHIDDQIVADDVWFHDPAGNQKQKSSVEAMRKWFNPWPGDYWTIFANGSYEANGISGHDYFINSGGTYRGGPLSYKPSVL